MATKTPKFLRVLYDILHTESSTILAWSPCGTYFQIFDVTRLEQNVLPRYFKHSKFASFQRQLNNFGFRKWTKTRASVCTFSHDSLVRCAPQQLGEMVIRSDIVSPHTKTTTSVGKRTRSDSDSTESGSDCDVMIPDDPKKLKASDDEEDANNAEESLLALLDCAFDFKEDDDIFSALEIGSDESGDLDWLLSDNQDELVDIFDGLFDSSLAIGHGDWSHCSV